jgi:hypothetical protein
VVGEILHIFLTYQALPEDFLSNLDIPINLFLLMEGYLSNGRSAFLRCHIGKLHVILCLNSSPPVFTFKGAEIWQEEKRI